MTSPKLDTQKVKDTILNYLKQNKSMRHLSELSIYRQDTLGVYAAWFTLKKDGAIKEVNGVTYLA